MVPEICAVDGCDQATHRREWCGKHYKRWYKYGDPTHTKFERFTDRREALKAKTVANNTGCLEWTGLTNAHGYGRIWDGEKVALAHRVSWTLSVGPIPPGMVLDHICHNPPCVNPSHLRMVTQAENIQYRKGAEVGNATGFRGVSYERKRKKYRAQVNHKGKCYYLGRYDTAEEAAEAARAKRVALGFLDEVTLDKPSQWPDWEPTIFKEKP